MRHLLSHRSSALWGMCSFVVAFAGAASSEVVPRSETPNALMSPTDLVNLKGEMEFAENDEDEVFPGYTSCQECFIVPSLRERPVCDDPG